MCTPDWVTVFHYSFSSCILHIQKTRTRQFGEQFFYIPRAGQVLKYLAHVVIEHRQTGPPVTALASYCRF